MRENTDQNDSEYGHFLRVTGRHIANCSESFKFPSQLENFYQTSYFLTFLMLLRLPKFPYSEERFRYIRESMRLLTATNES